MKHVDVKFHLLQTKHTYVTLQCIMRPLLIKLQTYSQDHY
jgi:hypothetical protein